jgi:hypothetical protein
MQSFSRVDLQHAFEQVDEIVVEIDAWGLFVYLLPEYTRSRSVSSMFEQTRTCF